MSETPKVVELRLVTKIASKIYLKRSGAHFRYSGCPFFLPEVLTEGRKKSFPREAIF